MASLRALLTAMMLIGATAADADDDDGIAPPVAHLTDSTGADLIAFKLACPSCAASKSELLLGDTCEPAFNPLQIDSSSAFSEMGTFSLAPGEYAEITTINPAGPAKSCLNTMDGCQTELRASYHYVDAKGVSRNYDGAPIKSGESLFPSLIPADASKSETQAQGPGLGDRKRGHWMYAGGVSDTTRTFGVAAKSSAGNCAEGLRMRIKKHKVTTQATSSASKQQGVLCTDVTSAGLDGSATIAPEETPIVAKSSYINVSTMVRRKFPNASAIRWWVQTKPKKISDVFSNVDKVCPTDADCCVNPSDNPTYCTVKCKFTMKLDFPYTFREGDRIAFKDENDKSVVNSDSPGLATFFADGHTDQPIGANKVLSVFGGFKIGKVTGPRPNNSSHLQATLEIDFNPTAGDKPDGWTFSNFHKWAYNQPTRGCPRLSTEFIHLPIGTANTWPTGGTTDKPVNGGDKSTPSPKTATWSWEPQFATESFKIKNGGGKISAPASLTKWQASASVMEINRGDGVFSPFSKTMLDAEDNKKNFIGKYSEAYVDSGIVALPSNLQLCSRVYCPAGTYLNDNGDCVLCDASKVSAGAKGALGNLKSYQQQVTKTLCKECSGATKETGTPNDNVAAYDNDPANRKQSNCRATCPYGMRRNDVKANTETCSVCPAGTFADTSRLNDYSNCKTCKPGLNIWDPKNEDPLKHDSEADCGTCPLGYVGKTIDLTCSMCPTGKYDGRSLAQQLRPNQGDSSCAGDDSCDSSIAGNCAICPLGRSTFPTKTNTVGNTIATFGASTAFTFGDSRDCQNCPAGYKYTSTFPTFSDGNCAQCPVDTYQTSGSNDLPSGKTFLGMTICDECKWGYGFDRTEDEKGTSLGACKDRRAYTCPPGQVGTPGFNKCTREGGQNDESCKTCPENQYTFGRQLKCTQCPTGKVIPADVDKLGNAAHHFSKDACAVDVDAVAVNTCVADQFAQEYDVANGVDGEHWITFMQSSSEWLQLGTCCTGDGCGKDQADGFQGEWIVAAQSDADLLPLIDLRKGPGQNTTIRRTMRNSNEPCPFPYKNCDGEVMTDGLIPPADGREPIRMWAKFRCLEPAGCTLRINNKKLGVQGNPGATAIDSVGLSRVLQYKIKARGCTIGEGAIGGKCETCPVGKYSPTVTSKASDGGCLECPEGKTLPDPKDLPNRTPSTGPFIKECAFALKKSTEVYFGENRCSYVGYKKLSDVAYVVQQANEVIYLSTRWCGRAACSQFTDVASCKSGSSGFSGTTYSCQWSDESQKCVAPLKSRLRLSTVTSPPQKIYKRDAGYYIREKQDYEDPERFYWETPSSANDLLSKTKSWPRSWATNAVDDNALLSFEYMHTLEATAHKRIVFVQAVCEDPLGCPGLRVTAEVRGCAAGSYGAPPHCKICPENSYGESDAPPSDLGLEKVCTRCPAGKSTSILAQRTPAHRASSCSCQSSWPMIGKAVDEGQAAFCETSLVRAKSVLPMSFKFPVGDTTGGSNWSTPVETLKEDPDAPNEKLFYHRGTPTSGQKKRPNDAQKVFVSFQIFQRAGTRLKFTPVTSENKNNAKNVYDKRPGTAQCGGTKTSFERSRQLRTLQMWAGDTMTEQKCTPMKHSVDFEVQGQPRANTSPDAGAYVSGSNDPWSAANPPKSTAQVPGVLTVGSACFDRVVYFKAEAEACPVDEDTGLPDEACAITIEVSEIESDTCIKDRIKRGSCDAGDKTKSDLVPTLGKFTVKGQVQIYGRCVSPHSFGTVGWAEVRDRITGIFKYREEFGEKFPESPYGDHCIGGGAACLVNGSAVGLASVSIGFADAKQGVALPMFCDPDPEGCTVTDLTKDEIIKNGPGARYRPASSYLSPLAKEMWHGGRRLFASILGGTDGHRRELAKGDKSDGGAVTVDVIYKDGTAPIGSTWADIKGTSPAAKRLVSSVVIDFTVENVRAADAGWAKALVADVLGGGDPIAQDFGVVDVAYLRKQGGKMGADANAGVDNDRGSPALGTHNTCDAASDIAAALKEGMRPMFTFAHVEFVQDSFSVVDEYEPCGLSPGQIAGIVIGTLAGVALIFLGACCVCRKQGKCGGDRNGTCMSCFSAASTGPSAPSGGVSAGDGVAFWDKWWCSVFRCSCDKCKRKKNPAQQPSAPSQANNVEMGLQATQVPGQRVAHVDIRGGGGYTSQRNPLDRPLPNGEGL